MTVSGRQSLDEHLQEPNRLAFSEKAEFIAVNFDTELDSVIFLPNSGDVLISSKASVDNLIKQDRSDASASQEIESFLKHLGIDIR